MVQDWFSVVVVGVGIISAFGGYWLGFRHGALAGELAAMKSRRHRRRHRERPTHPILQRTQDGA